MPIDAQHGLLVAKGSPTTMSTATLLRLAGVPLLLGAIIGAIVVAIHPRELTDPINGPVHVALFCGDLLVLLGWHAVLACQAGRISLFGPVGFMLAFIGLAFSDLTHSVLEFSIVPVLASDPATRPLLAADSPATQALMHGPYGLMLVLAMPLIVLGLLAFSVATLRANVLPRWPALLQLIAAVTLPLGMLVPPFGPIGPALFYVSMAAYAIVLLSPAAATNA